MSVIASSALGLNDVVLIVLFFVFLGLAFVTKEAFLFGFSAFFSIILGIDLALAFAADSMGWAYSIVGFGLILFSFWLVIAAFSYGNVRRTSK